MENTLIQNIKLNKYQTPLTSELITSLPEEVRNTLLDDISNIEFIKRLISPNRPYAKDLPRDDKGRIIIDITNPHILEDMDYFRQPALHYIKNGCYTFLRPNSNPNSEYRKYWDEERRRCLEGCVRESDGEWVPGLLYWFLNYSPMMVNVIKEGSKRAIRTESFPFMFEGIYWRFHYLEQARNNGHHAIELAKRGAHPYDEKVFTPLGWRNWGDIQIGDELYGTYGNITKVIDIPYDRECDIYEITLRDGRKVQASDEHLWTINFHNRKGTQTMSTLELLSQYKRKRRIAERNPKGVEYICSIPKNKGIEYPYHKPKIDPYTFGLLLGDGCFIHKSCYFTQLDEDLEIEKNYIPYNIIKWKGKYANRIDIPDWRNILEEYGLKDKKSEDKFIPDDFKYNSKEVRLSLLAGLMDSDGTLDNKNRYVISLSSKKLIEDIAFICRSLGYNCSCITKKAGYKINNIRKECLPAYILTIFTRDLISNLPRKQKSNKVITNEYTINRELRTRIIDIKYIGKKQAKCVTVDAKDNCYLIGDFVTTHNCGKSYSLAAIMSRNLILGETEESRKRIITVLTAYQKEYLSDSKDGTLSKFKPGINFCFSNTPFPRLMLKNSPNEMSWQMGYKDEYGVEKGSLNQVMAVSAKDDSEKLRGKRGWILFEEMGSFKGLLSLYDITRKSVEDGDYTFALMYLVGTSADDESDFNSAKTLLYNPEGYNIQSVKNVYDRPNQGKATFGYFFPSYINRAGCYNKDGVSDVIKALAEILLFRYKAKYSADPKSVLRIIAEDPITPAEAIIKVKAAYFPTTALTERLAQLDTDAHAYDDVYVGNLVMTKDNKVEFKLSNDIPIRKYGVDNSTVGALEIFEMPEKQANGELFNMRYIVGHDPVDNDQADSSSLSSTFVLDLFTDRIVAEYTGRHAFADDNFEVVRLLCLFYNAKCMYEAHPHSQLVHTPSGTKLWKDIKIGDKLFSPTKGEVTVTNIPIDEEMPIYKITLEDGRVIEASDNHIWAVYKGTSKSLVEMTTMQMLNSGVKNKWNQSKFFIPEHNGVEYNSKSLPIDPYTMGLILSKGSLRDRHCFKNGIQISSSCEDMKFYSNNIPYDVKHIGTKGVSWHVYIPDCKNIMLKYNLYDKDSYTKFIPSDYLYSNRVQRIELLKGLMDGDGCARTNGASIFITCSENLAQGILSLTRSLGIKSWLQTSREGVFRVAIASVHKIFKLPRKVVKQHVYAPHSKGSKTSALLNKTAIKSIEYSHVEMGKCVTVDSQDGLYLIGDYVVTHNCNKKGLYAYFSKMQCTHLLADTPEYLRDKQLIKYSAFGSNSKGINASAVINNYANSLIRDWLLEPIPSIIKEDGEEKEINMPRLYSLRNRALIEELIAFTPEINVDRIRAFGMVMLYRQEKIILYKDSLNARAQEEADSSYLGNDSFFKRNYVKNTQFSKFS